jgi:hypothetical protein
MDPFPNTAEATLEKRLQVLFQSSNTILVVPADPLDLRNNMAWLNTTTRKLKIYSEGVVWTIGSASVES